MKIKLMKTYTHKINEKHENNINYVILHFEVELEFEVENIHTHTHTHL